MWCVLARMASSLMGGDGAKGREPLSRMVNAIDLLVGRDRPLAERLATARRLAAELEC